MGPYRCTGSPTCEDGVDDVPFFEALLDEIGAWADVDPDRVFATGISNGGAMSYRLACDMPERIAGIASVAGMNAAETAPGCTPSEPVPVLHIHGTDDPCAPYGAAPPSARRPARSRPRLRRGLPAGRRRGGVRGLGREERVRRGRRRSRPRSRTRPRTGPAPSARR